MGAETNTQQRIVVTARLAPATLERLREIAEREDRSLSAELRRAAVEHIERYQGGDRARSGDAS
jgi:predicted transcriptional regulator